MTKSEESMAICAIRYTMGRRSYIVAEGQEWALQWGKKSKHVRDIIRRDLREEVQQCDQGYQALGDHFDEWCWRKVLDELDKMAEQDAMEESNQ